MAIQSSYDAKGLFFLRCIRGFRAPAQTMDELESSLITKLATTAGICAGIAAFSLLMMVNAKHPALFLSPAAIGLTVATIARKHMAAEAAKDNAEIQTGIEKLVQIEIAKKLGGR